MKTNTSLVLGAWLHVALLGAAATACSSSTSGGAGGLGASAAGVGGSTATTAVTGSASASGAPSATATGTTTSAGQTSTGGGCHGDATSWGMLTAGPIACTANADCCVIVNGCLSESQIVSAANQSAAKAAWPYCDTQCNDCIPPAIVVGCVSGACAGQVVDAADASPDLRMDHCGVDAPMGAVSGKLHFTCGGG